MIMFFLNWREWRKRDRSPPVLPNSNRTLILAPRARQRRQCLGLECICTDSAEPAPAVWSIWYQSPGDQSVQVPLSWLLPAADFAAPRYPNCHHRVTVCVCVCCEVSGAG